MSTVNIIVAVIGIVFFMSIFLFFLGVFGADTMKQIKEYTYPSSLSGQTQSNITNPNRMIGGKRKYKKYKK
jgi:hypothetical protein